MDTRTICLGVLNGGEATGYEIKKCIEEDFATFLEVSHSSIYPALADLLRDGLVSCTEVRQDGRPDKKVYRLTENGRDALLDGLMRSPGRHRVRSEFIGLLVFAEFLPPDYVDELIERRLEDFQQLVDYTRRASACDEASVGGRFAAGLGAAMVGAGAQYLRDNRGALVRALRDRAEADAEEPSS